MIKYITYTIVIGIVCIIYCCIIIGAKEERWMEERRIKKYENDIN